MVGCPIWVGYAHEGKGLHFESFHGLGLGFAEFVVMTGEVEKAVDDQVRGVMLDRNALARRLASGEIEVAPIACMRGRTLSDAFVILDEAQNTTREQMKMFLTRFGQNSRMVVCGDPKQVDIPGGATHSGLHDAVARLEGVDGIAVTRFTAGDVVRHPIVGRIVEAYEGKDA